jgi:hypothetical protein
MWKANGKIPHYYFLWIVSSRNRDKCEMLPPEKKKSENLKRRTRFGRGYGPVVR